MRGKVLIIAVAAAAALSGCSRGPAPAGAASPTPSLSSPTVSATPSSTVKAAYTVGNQQYSTPPPLHYDPIPPPQPAAKNILPNLPAGHPGGGPITDVGTAPQKRATASPTR